MRIITALSLSCHSKSVLLFGNILTTEINIFPCVLHLLQLLPAADWSLYPLSAAREYGLIHSTHRQKLSSVNVPSDSTLLFIYKTVTVTMARDSFLPIPRISVFQITKHKQLKNDFKRLVTFSTSQDMGSPL